MKTDTIVLATHNKGKIAELASLLAPFGLTVQGLEAFPHVPDVEETGTTFAENALLKACTVSRLTGLVAVADDSGIEVDALGGAPGVYSARYSLLEEGPVLEFPPAMPVDLRNTMKLLAALRETPDEKRGGRFRCCMAACTPDGDRLLAEASWEGVIAREKAGENGFGYDPIFYDPEKGRTAAQMSREEKNSRSHRAKAVRALLEKWPAFWRTWREGK